MLLARLGARDPMFTEGWGDRADLEALVRGGLAAPRGEAVTLEDERPAARARARRAVDRAFDSPAEAWLPREVARARVRHYPTRNTSRGALVVLAASREEGYDLREAIWAPLAERERVDVFLLENAYYGARRARGQRSASLPTVLDQLRMSVATVAEVDGLVRRLELDGFGRVGVTGYSMGGAIAALAGALVRRPFAVVPMAATLRPSTIYTEGLLSRSVAFDALDPSPAEGRRRLAELFGVADMSRFPPPVAVEASVLVGARSDGFVSREGTLGLARHWGAELRWIRGGHVSALFSGRRAMRRAALDALERLGRAQS